MADKLNPFSARQTFPVSAKGWGVAGSRKPRLDPVAEAGP